MKQQRQRSGLPPLLLTASPDDGFGASPGSPLRTSLTEASPGSVLGSSSKELRDGQVR